MLWLVVSAISFLQSLPKADDHGQRLINLKFSCPGSTPSLPQWSNTPPPTRVNPPWPQIWRCCQTGFLYMVPRLSQLTLFGHLIRMLPGGPRLEVFQDHERELTGRITDGTSVIPCLFCFHCDPTICFGSLRAFVLQVSHFFGQVYSSESTHLALLLLLGCLPAWRMPDRRSYGHRENRLKEVWDISCGNLRWLAAWLAIWVVIP